MTARTPFSAAAERNKGPILAALQFLFRDCRSILEIGSGSGQHAVHFAAALTWLRWQPSDVPAVLPGLQQTVDARSLPNLAMPLALDVSQEMPSIQADGVFSANTLHIMSWPEVLQFLTGAATLLPLQGRLVVYGPFHYGGKPTSASNAVFDAELQARGSGSGIRNIDDVLLQTAERDLRLLGDLAMPANNRLLAWEKVG